VDLLLSVDQVEIVNQVAAYLSKELPLTRVRQIAAGPSTVDRALWRQLADLGWFGLALAERDGGVGFSVAEEVLLFREIGRHLTPGPLLSSVVAAHVAARAGASDLVKSILNGDLIVGMAHLDDLEMGVDGHNSVTGRAFVLDGQGVDLLLVAAPDGCALVELDDRLASRPCVDPATRLARIVFDSQRVLARADGSTFWDRGALLSAAMCVGIAEAVRDSSASYAAVRVQYGRPIGSFQAVKHRCAEMAVRAEAAFCQLCYAALALQDGHDDARFHVSAAKIVASDGATANAADNVQNHGGIGFTAEHDAQLFVKRAYVLEHVFGDGRWHARAIVGGDRADQVSAGREVAVESRSGPASRSTHDHPVLED
jgi:alkylation response protein AidB-like acyl-CoA dehydrogenase